MEPHPVPQQIMDVDFKLFGSFSLKQFLRILIACALAFAMYFVEPIPIFLRFGIMGFVVIMGFFFAVIPKFEVWVSNFAKAVFISPRYIWIREYRTPEILTVKPVSSVDNLATIQVSSNKKKIDINDLPLSQMFGNTQERGAITESQSGDSLETNFERVYGNIYKNTKKVIQKSILDNKSSPKPKMGEFKPSFKTLEEYENAIRKLKFELSKVSADPKLQPKEDQIMARISELFEEMKIIKSHGVVIDSPVEVISRGGVSKIAQIQKRGKLIFGIVVDKSDKPVAGAQVTFLKNDEIKAIVVSDISGRFSTSSPLAEGEYEVKVNDGGKHKFHSYKIIVADKNLPGYKLREK